MARSVAVIDYGAGNILNVLRAFLGQGIEAEMVSDPRSIRNHSHLVLPGVGSFHYGIEELTQRKLGDEILAFAEAGKPLFGICLGMQLMAKLGFENGMTAGLGLISGNVVHLRQHDSSFSSARIPHTGWSPLKWRGDGEIYSSPLLTTAYFNHSYFLANALESEIAATTAFAGDEIPVAIRSGSIFSTQFHPEKSGPGGLRLLRAWVLEN